MFKKISAGVLACLMLGALAANVSAVESTKTLTVPRVEDGTINFTDKAARDAAYDLCEMQEIVEQNLDYFPDSPANSNGKFWACYDSEYLYVYVEMTDAVIDYSHEDPNQTWNRESVGVMIDFDYVREEAYEYNYADNGDRVAYLNFAGDFVAVTYHIYANDLPETDPYYGLYDMLKLQSVADTGDGRILYEMALPWPDDFNPVEGAKFGFEICAPNAEDGGRQGNVSWSPEGSEMWHYTDVCGTVTLGAAPVVEEPAVDEPAVDAPVDAPAEAPVTADAGIVAAAAVMAVAAGVVLSKKH
jgi:hypothetical protein